MNLQDNTEEVLPNEEDATLHLDETTKWGHHVLCLLVCTKDAKTYTLGLCEVRAGKAKDYFDAGMDSLYDINRSFGCNNHPYFK